MNLSESLKREFFSGWRPFEVVWLVLFISAQMIAYYYDPPPIDDFGYCRYYLRGVGIQGKNQQLPVRTDFCLHLFLCSLGQQFPWRNEYCLIRLYSFTIHRLFYVA